MRNVLIVWVACTAGVWGFTCAAVDASPPPVAVPVPSAVIPTSAPPPPADIPAGSAPLQTPKPPEPVTATLNDGSKVEFDADSTVWVLGADGSKNPAPDGTLTLRDGTPFLVKDGRRVDE